MSLHAANCCTYDAAPSSSPVELADEERVVNNNLGAQTFGSSGASALSTRTGGIRTGTGSASPPPLAELSPLE
jgi:hypothetical protein